MADKYIRHGEIYCGNGTSSAAATSNGGVGAWNNLNVFEGTAPAYGVLAAGDVVYIRSKDQAGGAISVSKAVQINLGSSSATENNPLTWIIDPGLVWSGITGVITFSTTVAGAGICIIAYNNVLATDYNLVLSSTASSTNNSVFFGCQNCNTRDIKIDTTANGIPGVPGSYHSFAGGTHINTWIRQGSITYAVIGLERNVDTTLISPKLELIGPLYQSASFTAIFSLGDSVSNKFVIYGGEVITTLAGMLVCKTGSYAVGMEAYGFKYPRTFTIGSAAYFEHKTSISFNGNDGALGSEYMDYFCSYSSRFDGYYPTLNAQLELSTNAAWSYAIYPYRTTPQQPAKVAVSKLWTQAASVKTVTLELLWPNSMAAPNTSNVWMTVQYTDNSTGNKVTHNTLAFPGVSLSSSIANWSASTYGPTNFTKLKIALATQFSIKQDSEVLVTLFISPKSTSSSDIIILCPDVVLS